MEIQAAVFRKVLEPLTIEAIDIDKPLGRDRARQQPSDEQDKTHTRVHQADDSFFEQARAGR